MVELHFKLWMEDWGDTFPNANTETAFKGIVRSRRQADPEVKGEKPTYTPPEIVFGYAKKKSRKASK